MCIRDRAGTDHRDWFGRVVVCAAIGRCAGGGAHPAQPHAAVAGGQLRGIVSQHSIAGAIVLLVLHRAGTIAAASVAAGIG